jgi:hypothetical protein
MFTMNPLPEWLREGNEHLRPTPTISSSQATLKALGRITFLAFAVFPNPTPGSSEPFGDSIPLYQMHESEANTSNANFEGKDEVPEPLPSPPAPNMSITSRVLNGRSSALPPSPPRSNTSSDTPTTSRVHDRAEGRRALGRALSSARNRRPETWRQAEDEMIERGECVELIYVLMKEAGIDE